MPFLKVFTGAEERTVFLGDDPIVFGRGADVDVLLKDHKASREHCVIEKDAKGRWRVLDLQSGNGTRVNGERIQSRVLQPEDVVEVGDAKVLFASEGVAVVAQELEPEQPVEQEPPARVRRAAPSSSKTPIILGAVGVAVLFGMLLFWQASKNSLENDDTTTASGSGQSATPDIAKPKGRTAEQVLASLPANLDVYARVTAVEELLAKSSKDDRPGVMAALAKANAAVKEDRDRFFAGLESEFRKQLDEGEFARAREIWFFLRGDEKWSPVPSVYRDRIIRELEALEHRASAARSRLLDEVSRAEEAHDFEHAETLVRDAMPRFAGTSVERSLNERIAEIERARRVGVSSDPTKPKTRVRADVRKQLQGLLAKLPERDFDAVAKSVRALVADAREGAAREELERRATEVEAAAALQGRLVAALRAGVFPKKQIQRKWRIAGGDANQLQVTSKGATLSWPWTEVPAALHIAILMDHVGDDKSDLSLGLAVIANAIGGDADRAVACSVGYRDGKVNPALDRFLAEIVRNEPLPEGGYVVHEGSILARAEFVRKQEEALIARYQAQLDKAYAAIKTDKSLKKLDKLNAKMAELDKRREHALALIFDEKKYFYPYRSRMAEYAPVQKEVDHRVAAVREVWDDPSKTSISYTDSVKRHLKAFDEAAVELNKRYVDIEEKEQEVTFLRSYFGSKFTIRSFYRSAEEKELLRYGDEVMADNVKVPGDITGVEREQVRVTNEYRRMFGRWPVRVVEKLVLSSRGHCEEMARIGYFGHFSPTPGRKTPYDRMRLVGYEYGASENCAKGTGDPASAHRMWCHSSGHHRNLLMVAWTELGSGHYSSHWTQNFGRAPKHSKAFPKSDAREWETPGEDLSDAESEDSGDESGEDPYDYESDD